MDVKSPCSFGKVGDQQRGMKAQSHVRKEKALHQQFYLLSQQAYFQCLRQAADWRVVYSIVWYGMVWYGMVWYGMVWYGMVWYGMVWYGMVWYGMVWYGMVWYGMVWYGMVWYGMVW